jgi:hypothetical protein
MTNIATHQFNGKLINQLSEDTLIAGRLIPKGYVNATEICKANGKKWSKYLEFSKTPEFLKALTEVLDKDFGVAISILGGNEQELQGTWVCLPLALNLAQWCSPKFAAWASVTLSYVITGDYQGLISEAEQAQIQLQEHWLKIRQAGKVTRRTYTDAIKDYIDRTPNLSENSKKFMYANCSDQINRSLFGLPAIKLKTSRGFKDTDLTRNCLTEKELQLLDRVEDFAMRLMDRQNSHPIVATVEALEFYG